jgi:DNA-binding CsgD family transcriptional regulator
MAGSVAGRASELATVGEVLSAARDGLRLLMIEGEPGIGKTTVWREAIAQAGGHGYRVLSCRAAQAEMRLSFAGLGDLLAPVEPDAFAVLPGPQRRGLEVALLRVEAGGDAPDPRAIGTGVVSLVSALAAAGPVLVAVDDVQWLDRRTARALEFALRRLEDAPVAVVATLRVGGRGATVGLLSAVDAARVCRVRLGPLGLGGLYELLSDRLGRALTRPLLGAIERVSRGNPFYALEIARALDPERPPASGEALPVPDEMRELVARRLRRLPRRTQDELLKAGALAEPTVSLVDPAALGPAEEAGVVSVRSDGRVEFSHPLFASTMYAGVSRERRQRLHRELGAVVSDIEERARHVALAADGPDARLAETLERAAERAYARGAREVAAELAEQATRRTPAQLTEARWERCLRAARHHFKAGNRLRARVLGEELVAASPSSPLRAEALHLLAQERGIDEPKAAIPLLEEALACVGDDLGPAAQLETSLGYAASVAVDLAGAVPHLDRAVELAESARDDALLAEATAMRALARFVLGLGADHEALERALALEDPDREVPVQRRPSLIVAQLYEFTGRIDVARGLLVSMRKRIVARGEESDLPYVLAHLAETSRLAGHLAIAEREADDALRVATLRGEELFRAFALMVRAMVRALRGDVGGSRADAAEALAISERIGWWWGENQTRGAQALLALSEDHARAALDALEPVMATVEAIGVYEYPIAMWLPDAIEAFVATGELERAARLTGALADWGHALDRPWALATSGRGRALLAAARGELERAQTAAEQALVEHERLPMPLELGRTLLVLGQVQRRRGQRRAARASLQHALTVFDEVGAPLWAEKARTEARRIGLRRAPTQLTENELLVARLAATGLTNREVADRMFISRRTVEANLARAYRKLGIHSRAELGATMAGASARHAFRSAPHLN